MLKFIGDVHLLANLLSRLYGTSSTAMNSSWNSIECSQNELRIDITLACGQAFRWHQTNDETWIGVFSGHVWELKQTDSHLLYRAHSRKVGTLASAESGDCKRKVKHPSVSERIPPVSNPGVSCTTADYRNQLVDYFRLSVNLQDLYTEWSKNDSKLCSKTRYLKGVRQLRQDPVETLFTFICSSNNNISRITGMIDRMCEKYGQFITELDGKSYFDFPRLEILAGEEVDAGLRELGFGYRAAYINKTAQYIIRNHSTNFLHELRGWSYEDAKAELMKFHGVGAKVADCVCLMALDKMEAVPVDTHVWQVAVRDYKPPGISAVKSLTATAYSQIGDFFRKLWGPYAGWAQTVVFTAELKPFQQSSLLDKRKRSVDCGKDTPFLKKKKEQASTK